MSSASAPFGRVVPGELARGRRLVGGEKSRADRVVEGGVLGEPLSGPAARQKASTSCGATTVCGAVVHSLIFPSTMSLIQRRVEPNIRAPARIVEVDRIGGHAGIEALRHQIGLLLLERHRHLDLAAHAQEQRPRVAGQQRVEMRAQGREIDRIVGDDRRHAGAALVARHGDAVHGGVADAAEAADGFGDLRGRNVLALPAKSVADPVDEIEIAALVAPHQVAGAEPGVARREDVAQDLPLAVGCASA